MNHFCSVLFAASILCSLGASDLAAQKNKAPSNQDGYIPVVAPENPKNKKKNEDVTQTLPPERELPLALEAEASRLAFAVSPLSSKGLLSQQTREALNALLRKNHGTIIKLRAFVAGSGDLRRIGDLAGELFTEKHEPFPVLSVMQVGALPLQGAQVVIESTEMDRKPVNEDGIVFFAAEPAADMAQSVERLKNKLATADPGARAEDVLRVTCFVSTLDQSADAGARLTGSFPKAALNYLQMQREPASPGAECEMVARSRPPFRPGAPSTGPGSFKSVDAGAKLIITGTQLAFGGEQSDLKLALQRLEKALSASNAHLDDVVMAHIYTTPGSAAVRNGIVQAQFANAPSTLLPVEALPSLDASFGLDVIVQERR